MCRALPRTFHFVIYLYLIVVGDLIDRLTRSFRLHQRHRHAFSSVSIYMNFPFTSILLPTVMHGHLKIKTHILLTGATGNALSSCVGSTNSFLGYIGGSVLTRLLSHPLSDTFRTTVLVRDASKATQFRSMGVRAIVGSYSDLSLLTQLATEADLVLACVRTSCFSLTRSDLQQADADDLSATEAILEGLKIRFEKTGKIPSLIHTVSDFSSEC